MTIERKKTNILRPILLRAHEMQFVTKFSFFCTNEIILAVHKAKSFIPAGTCLRHLSSVIAVDRDSFIQLFFSLWMSYQDMLTSLALQEIIVIETGAVHFMLRGERLVSCSGSQYIHLSRVHELIKMYRQINQNV